MTLSGVHVVFHRMVPAPYDQLGKQQKIQAVLLCKRNHDAPVHPGYWGLFGGRLENSENPVGGLRRECREELEAKSLEQALENPTHLTDVSTKRDGKTISIRYYEAPLTEEMDSLQLKRNEREKKVEGEGLGWFTEEEIHHLWLRPEDRTALGRFFQRDT